MLPDYVLNENLWFIQRQNKRKSGQIAEVQRSKVEVRATVPPVHKFLCMVPGIRFIHSNKYFPIHFITNLFILTIYHRLKKKKLAMARIRGNMPWNACFVNYNSIDWPNCFGGWSIPLHWIWVGLIIYLVCRYIQYEICCEFLCNSKCHKIWKGQAFFHLYFSQIARRDYIVTFKERDKE